MRRSVTQVSIQQRLVEQQLREECSQQIRCCTCFTC